MSDYIYNISFVPLVDLTVVSGGLYQAALCEKEPQLC